MASVCAWPANHVRITAGEFGRPMLRVHGLGDGRLNMTRLPPAGPHEKRACGTQTKSGRIGFSTVTGGAGMAA
ncbi:hypothetical protein L0337_12005 [candidate division KSB1 bacterium]|nr:hypothetical protein [candidate division KSB1 bacterium]